MQNDLSIVGILWRYCKNEELDPKERAFLGKWLEASEANQLLFDELSNEGEWERELSTLKSKDDRATWDIIEGKVEGLGGFEEETINWKKFIAVAAAVFLLFGSGLYFYLKPGKTNIEANSGAEAVRYKNDIMAGQHYAILRGDDQAEKILDPKGLQALAREQEGIVPAADAGSIVYKPVPATGAMAYHTLITPCGTQFMVQLTDGTKVWLNSESTLQYPVRFDVHERTVTLTGEGYFEVAKDASRPFQVQVGKETLRVLGTHFNVRAYEGFNATLLEGAVAIRNGRDSVILKPGERGNVLNDGDIQVGPANIPQTLAWRKNSFWFQEASYEEIMQELARWYPMKVSYEGRVKAQFSGVLPRTQSLAQLLKNLEGGGHVEFLIDGDRVTVKAI
jgi:transmembrane sensor